MHTILGFHESAFPCLFHLELFQTKNFLGGGPPDPPPLHRVITNTLYNAKTIMSDVFLCWANTRWAISYLKKAVLMAKLDFNRTNAELDRGLS